MANLELSEWVFFQDHWMEPNSIMDQLPSFNQSHLDDGLVCDGDRVFVLRDVRRFFKMNQVVDKAALSLRVSLAHGFR